MKLRVGVRIVSSLQVKETAPSQKILNFQLTGRGLLAVLKSLSSVPAIEIPLKSGRLQPLERRTTYIHSTLGNIMTPE